MKIALNIFFGIIIFLFSCKKTPKDYSFIESERILKFIDMPNADTLLADGITIKTIKVYVDIFKNHDTDYIAVPVENRNVLFKTSIGLFTNEKDTFTSTIDQNGYGFAYLKSTKAGYGKVIASIDNKYSISKEIICIAIDTSLIIDSIVDADFVVADNFTYLNNKIKVRSKNQIIKEFRLDIGTFENDSPIIKVLPDANGYYNLRVKSGKIGTDNLSVIVNNTKYLLRQLKYIPLTNIINKNEIIGVDTVLADNQTFLLNRLKINSNEQPERTFTLNKGTFDNNQSTVKIIPDVEGYYNLYIKSATLGSDEISVTIGSLKYIIRKLTYTQSTPDKITIGLNTTNNQILFQPFTSTDITFRLSKNTQGKVNLLSEPNLVVTSDSSGKSIGHLINKNVTNDFTEFNYQFYLTDTLYQGFINFKATIPEYNLTEIRTVYFKVK